jgi:hypothetical protein
MLPSWKVRDPELSPLDLLIAPSGNIVVSSEHPFGAANAMTTVREYDQANGCFRRLLVSNYVSSFGSREGHALGRMTDSMARLKTKSSLSIRNWKLLWRRCEVASLERPRWNFLFVSYVVRKETILNR